MNILLVSDSSGFDSTCSIVSAHVVLERAPRDFNTITNKIRSEGAQQLSIIRLEGDSAAALRAFVASAPKGSVEILEKILSDVVAEAVIKENAMRRVASREAVFA